MSEESTQYSFTVKLDVSYEKALERVIQALQDEGFGALTRIDVRETLKAKLDTDFRKYMIIGACNPSLAHRALSADLGVGLLLPCNVVVYEDDGGSTVAMIDPLSMMGFIHNPDLEQVAQEARGRLQRVAKALAE
ncbi:MAG: DUF302 domain-containing protein [Chloroflexi bacterium]|nr:DUF302 domain-containing protein [Chloroflexota bacterium]